MFLLLYVGMTHSPALHSPYLMVVHKDASSGSGGHPSPGGAGSSFTPVSSMHHHHHHHNTTTVDIETPPRPLSTQTPGMQSHPQASSSPLSNHGNTQGTASSCPVTDTICHANHQIKDLRTLTFLQKCTRPRKAYYVHFLGLLCTNHLSISSR